MVLVGVGLLLVLGRASTHRARPFFFVADMIFQTLGDAGVVGVVNDGGIYVIDVSVVGEVATAPALICQLLVIDAAMV